MVKTNEGHVHCPVNAWDCPYFGKHDICTMWPDSDPREECDDFGYYCDPLETIWDWVCYDEH
jgi:hypothetical protein